MLIREFEHLFPIIIIIGQHTLSTKLTFTFETGGAKSYSNAARRKSRLKASF